MSSYIVPLIIILLIIACAVKKQSAYDAFVSGAKQSFTLVLNVLPYVAAIFLAIELFNASGLEKVFSQLFAPVLNVLGIPPQLAKLIAIRPFSGSGSLAVLEEIYKQYGVDSYIGLCAGAIAGGTETVFYIASVYFASTNVKKLGWAVPIALFCSFVSCIAACLLCRFYV